MWEALRGAKRALAPVRALALRAKKRVVLFFLRRVLLRKDFLFSVFTARELNEAGLNVVSVKDFYSPLPLVTELERTQRRWNRPSNLAGLRVDVPQMQEFVARLAKKFSEEYKTVAPYEENHRKGFGFGYTPVDAMLLYLMIRDLQPRRYLEVGSGLSTFYASLAAERNAQESKLMRITCIEPYPHAALRTHPGIELIAKEAQDVEVSSFEQLDSGDLLFIDSSHVVRVDGDVPFLFLEVLPRLKRGVIVHIHDVPFPFNVPRPAGTWILDRNWPMFWTEAMLVQALLCHSTAFEIRLSMPLLRFHDEQFLHDSLPGYSQLEKDGQLTFSSLWLEKIA